MKQQKDIYYVALRRSCCQITIHLTLISECKFRLFTEIVQSSRVTLCIYFLFWIWLDMCLQYFHLYKYTHYMMYVSSQSITSLCWFLFECPISPSLSLMVVLHVNSNSGTLPNSHIHRKSWSKGLNFHPSMQTLHPAPLFN